MKMLVSGEVSHRRGESQVMFSAVQLLPWWLVLRQIVVDVVSDSTSDLTHEVTASKMCGHRKKPFHFGTHNSLVPRPLCFLF